MADKNVDRRKFRRVYFSMDDDVIGVFKMADKPGDRFEANILNLSPGGVHFSIEKGRNKYLQVGDKLSLTRIRGREELDFEFNTEISIVWVLGHESLKYIGYGAEFHHASKWLVNRLSRFVEKFYDQE